MGRGAVMCRGKRVLLADASKTLDTIKTIPFDKIRQHLTWGLPKWGRTEAVFQLFVFQFGFSSGRIAMEKTNKFLVLFKLPL